MSNRTVILLNVQPGDILLARRARDPLSSWRRAYLCLEDKMCLYSGAHGIEVIPVGALVVNETLSFGLFRLTPPLEINKHLEDLAYRVLYGWFKTWWHKLLCLLHLRKKGLGWDKKPNILTEETIARVYEKLGYSLANRPYLQVEALDLDKSSFTVRIA